MVKFLSDLKPYLLDPNVLADSPVPIFKSFTQLIFENSWAILVVILLTAGSCLYYFLKKKDKPQNKADNISVPIDPYADATEQLNKLASANPRPKPKPFVFRLSEILRLYVERQFDLPALECTGEEFIRKVTVHPFLRKKFAEPLKDFVSKGDRIKYSSQSFHSKELDDLLISAQEFIKQAQRDFNSQMDKERVVLNPHPITSK